MGCIKDRAIIALMRRRFALQFRDLYLLLKFLAKWLIFGGAVGVLAGLASAIFLISLDWATRTRLANPNLLFGLPLAGFAVGWVYQRFGGIAAQGNTLVIEEVHSNQDSSLHRIPRRMAPLILLGTVITHLFGGSAGREGTALQMGASLADGLRGLLQRWLPIRLQPTPPERRLMLMAGISGGFGAVFGTPVAGAVFGMEVQTIGRVRYEGLVPCLVAAYVGDLVVRGLGVAHTHYPHIAHLDIAPGLLLKVAIAGVLCGLVSHLFIELNHAIKHAMTRIRNSAMRPVLGGFVIIALTLALNSLGISASDYLGLGVPLALGSTQGQEVFALAFLLKLVYTAVTLGTGFLGGEVTPLFVIGATLGSSLGRWLNVDPAFMASLGFVAVFAGASNAPIACALMGLELFGGASPVYFLLICAAAYLASGHRSIYVTQRIGVPKSPAVHAHDDERVRDFSARRAKEGLGEGD